MIMKLSKGVSFKVIEVIATLILNAAYCSGTDDGILSCSGLSVRPCSGDNQICNLTVNECVCAPGFVMVGKVCEVTSTDYASKHSATAAVVTIFTLALLICGLVLVIRKYHLIDYLREKFNFKRNDVMYEDVMIGQDDPPLTP